MGEWISSQEVKGLFGWAHSQHLSRVAKREGWRVEKRPGCTSMYYREDILAYKQAIDRTRVIRNQRGKSLHGPIERDDSFDTICPICGEFAVYKVPKFVGRWSDWSSYRHEYRQGTREITCVNDHKTKGGWEWDQKIGNVQ